MHRGTLFVLVFFVLAPGVAACLLWRGVRRAIREPKSRWKIFGVAAMAFAVWIPAEPAPIELSAVAGDEARHPRQRGAEAYARDYVPNGYRERVQFAFLRGRGVITQSFIVPAPTDFVDLGATSSSSLPTPLSPSSDRQ